MLRRKNEWKTRISTKQIYQVRRWLSGNSDGIVMNVDLAPTFLELAGVAVSRPV
ncbi:hypothetical protein [Sphingobacterium chuzhouense]|uniref:Uncharacterized protein n=1 Tax=Sphingobacterium chuzhouense TaxID=1742264 RepID=A0ABR7XVX4_9SPHI|nr:hypothetical protein [Sphingobacterium chuzhouense]MBD1423198.1 hypothetical protein [Sphingobacterium chuzhouense]